MDKKELEIVETFNIITSHLRQLDLFINEDLSSDLRNYPHSFYTFINKELLTSMSSLLNDYNNLIVYFAKKSKINETFIHTTFLKILENDNTLNKVKIYFKRNLKTDSDYLNNINKYLVDGTAINTRDELLKELNNDFKKFITNKNLGKKLNEFLFYLIWEKFDSINEDFHEHNRFGRVGAYKKQVQIGRINNVTRGFKFLGNRKQLSKLYLTLFGYNYITTLEIILFKQIFLDQIITEKISWNGKISTLYYFIYRMHSDNFLIDLSNEKWKKTALSFNLNDKPIDFKKLRRLNKTKECETIDEIFSKFKIDG